MELLDKRVHKISWICFFAAFLIYYTTRFIESTMLADYKIVVDMIDFIKMISYILVCVHICMSFLAMKKKITAVKCVVGVFVLYFLYEAVFLGERSVFIVLLFALGFYFQSEDRDITDVFFKMILWYTIGLFVLTIILCIVGIIPNSIDGFNKLNLSLNRYSMGFYFPGQLLAQLIPICMMYYYVYRNDIRYYHNILWVCVILLNFAVCKVITGTILLLAFIVLFNIIKKYEIKIKTKWIQILIYHSGTIAGIFTCILLWLKCIDSKLVWLFDKISNGRLVIGALAVEKYGITWFGSDYKLDQRMYYNVLDSEYMYFVISAGIIYSIVVLILMYMLMRYGYKKNSILCLCLIIYYIYSIVNNGVFNLSICPFSILLVNAIKTYVDDKIGKKK